MRSPLFFVVTVGVVLLPWSIARAAEMGTAFTYQGRLENGSGPVTDTCNFRFGLWDDSVGGTQVGDSPQSIENVEVTGGEFVIETLDFGAAGIDGTARWLETEVICNGDLEFTLLTPRIRLAPTPHALALPGFYTQQTGLSPNIVGGDANNRVDPDVLGATISGGGSPIGGPFFGEGNWVTDDFGTVSGGAGNIAGDFQGDPTDAEFATIGGGYKNQSRNYSVVGGGTENWAFGYRSTIGGGGLNRADGIGSTVSGGVFNSAAGDYSIAVGGTENVAYGSYSLVAGQNAVANFPGMFVWASDPWISRFPSDFETNFTPAPRQFLAKAVGGVVFVTSTEGIQGASTAGVQVFAGSGSWSSFSDQNAKNNIEQVDPKDILNRLAEVPVSTWHYKSQESSIRHIGPMAQDFHAAFNVGEDDRFITSIDADGVALAAIQGLHQIVQEKDCEIENLKSEISNLKELEARLARLEAVLHDTTDGMD